MSATALVSVIVPVFNSADHLGRCLDSILAQTHRHLEVILVDDGSTDSSGAICDQFAQRDHRVRVIHQANGGIGRAQNTGLDTMSGHYVTFCDNDDLVSPYLVERLLALLDASGADMSQCRWANIGLSQAANSLSHELAPPPTGRTVVFDQPAVQYQTIFSKLERMLRPNGEFRYLNEANWGKLYPATTWAARRFPEGVFAQDAYINTELYLSMNRVAACADVLYYWIQHGASLTHKARSFHYHRDILDCAFHNIEVAQSAGILPRRSFYALSMEMYLIGPSARTQDERAIADHYLARCHDYLHQLSAVQNLSVQFGARLRRLETYVYSKTIHQRS